MSLETTNEDGTPMSMAQEFGNNDMLFTDIPSTPAQRIVDGYVAFDDGSYLIVRDGSIEMMTGAGAMPSYDPEVDRRLRQATSQA